MDYVITCPPLVGVLAVEDLMLEIGTYLVKSDKRSLVDYVITCPPLVGVLAVEDLMLEIGTYLVKSDKRSLVDRLLCVCYYQSFSGSCSGGLEVGDRDLHNYDTYKSHWYMIDCMIWVYYYRSSFSGCGCSGGLGTLKVLLQNTIELATGGPCGLLPLPVFTFSQLEPVFTFFKW